MAIVTRSMFAGALVAATALTAHARPGAEGDADPDPIADAPPDATLAPPSAVAPERGPSSRRDPLVVHERWGGGVRMTGLSGIGALPGVNYGGELAGHLRRDDYFAELALARWKPRDTYVVTGPDHVELGLDVWTARAGWASMAMPLRAWVLVEAGELAGSQGMQGVVTRMVTGDTPAGHRWVAAGGGFGVAWPIADMVRLFGALELAIPLERQSVMLDRNVGTYEPDALVARYSIGLEVGLR